jgi:hypothetical protein
MKKSLLFSTLIVIIFCLSISCKKDNGDDDKKPLPANPVSTFVKFLKVGNIWVYDVTFNQMQGVNFTYEVKSNTANGYYLISTSAGSNTWDRYWYADESIFADGAAPTQSNFKVILLKKNPSLHDSWTFNDPEEDVTITRTVTSLSEQVESMTGTFDCIKITETHSDTDTVVEYWINITNGIIKMRYSGTDQGDLYEQILILKSKNF